MPPKTFTLCVPIVMLLMISNSAGEVSKGSVEKIKNGLSFGENAVAFLSKLGNSEKSKVFSSLGKMASFLGAAGGLVSFALSFVPKSQSVELKYMKEKFAEVNRKLDKITSELDNVKDLITYENQRAIYVGAANKVLFAHRQLLAFLNELESTSCEDEDKCKRAKTRIAYRYVNDFNVKQDIFKILNGAVKNTEIFGDPLLHLVKITFKCNVGKIDLLADGILKLAIKAQQAILAYDRLMGSDVRIAQSMSDWLKPLYVLRDNAYITKKQCFDQISDYMIRDINDKKYQFEVSSNNKANREVKKFMDNKYNWLGWVRYFNIISTFSILILFLSRT